MLAMWEYTHMMALGTLNTIVPRLSQYLRYLSNEVKFSYAGITFDRLYEVSLDCWWGGWLIQWCWFDGVTKDIRHALSCLISSCLVLTCSDHTYWYFWVYATEITTFVCFYAHLFKKLACSQSTCNKFVSSKSEKLHMWKLQITILELM